MNKNKTQIKEETFEITKEELLNEDFIETALLGAGFVPGVSSFANIALIIRYYKQERFIECGLMLLALIPFVGDMMVWPFLKIFKGIKGASALKNSSKFMQILSKNPEAKQMFLKMNNKMKGPEVEKIISKVNKKNPKWGEALRDIQQNQIKMGSQIAASKGMQRTVSTAIKKPFQQKALGKYLIKTGGVPPSTKLSNWWNIVYKGGRMRKNFVTKLILGSNLLGALGVGSIAELEKKLWNDEEASKLMQNPQFAKVYNDSMRGMSEDEIDSIENPSSSEDTGGNLGGLLQGSGIGIAGLKFLAKFV